MRAVHFWQMLSVVGPQQLDSGTSLVLITCMGACCSLITVIWTQLALHLKKRLHKSSRAGRGLSVCSLQSSWHSVSQTPVTGEQYSILSGY